MPERADWKTELRQRLRRRLVWKIPLIILLVGFAVWWQWRQSLVTDPRSVPAASANAMAAKLAGRWFGEATYGSGARHREEFFFTPEGNLLFGTASFMGIKRGIEEGHMVGATILFKVSVEETSGGTNRIMTHLYEGGLNGEQLVLKFFERAGGAPVTFSLSRQSDGPTPLPAKP